MCLFQSLFGNINLSAEGLHRSENVNPEPLVFDPQEASRVCKLLLEECTKSKDNSVKAVFLRGISNLLDDVSLDLWLP